MHAPTSTDEVAAIVAKAAAARTTLEVIGTGTRRGLGRPVVADAVLSLAGLTGIVDYDPGELVLTARAGTSLADIAAAVAAAGQHLAFEPPDHAPLWGGEPGAGTIGGMLAVGWGGPRRVVAGAPRDHFLGFTAVNGSGEVFAAGGKVIKNVTGYDLPKLLAASFGTLAVLTEVTIKTLPAPRAAATVVIEGLDPSTAVAAMMRALGSRVGVSGAAHAAGTTRLRVEGLAEAIGARAAYVAEMFADAGARTVGGDAGWAEIGAVQSFLPADAAVWRVSLPATATAMFVARVAARDAVLDWGGGLIWLAMPDDGDAGAAKIRAAIGGDGHATLVRACADVHSRVAPFQPLPPPLAALEERVRQRFDPAGVLNPGRRVAA